MCSFILGAMFRHHGLSWWPHVVHAVVVSFVLAWTAVRALTVYPHIEAVRRPAIMMLSLLISPALPRLYCISDARGVGPGRGAAGASHGPFDRGPRCGGRAVARDGGDPGNPGVAACSGRLRRTSAAGATGSNHGIACHAAHNQIEMQLLAWFRVRVGTAVSSPRSRA